MTAPPIISVTRTLKIGSNQKVCKAKITIKKETKFSHDIKFSNDGNDGTLYKCLKSNKFREEFGWSELTNLDVGLKKTIEWYKSYIS